MKELNEYEIHEANQALLKLVDGKNFNNIVKMLEDALGQDMLSAGSAQDREAVAAEHRVLTKFVSRLTDIANSARTGA